MHGTSALRTRPRFSCKIQASPRIIIVNVEVGRSTCRQTPQSSKSQTRPRPEPRSRACRHPSPSPVTRSSKGTHKTRLWDTADPTFHTHHKPGTHNHNTHRPPGTHRHPDPHTHNTPPPVTTTLRPQPRLSARAMKSK